MYSRWCLPGLITISPGHCTGTLETEPRLSTADLRGAAPRMLGPGSQPRAAAGPPRTRAMVSLCPLSTVQRHHDEIVPFRGIRMQLAGRVAGPRPGHQRFICVLC